jgi:peptidyl-dipeptidase Dcp
MSQTNSPSMNPLLTLSTLPFGAFPFDRVEKRHFKPALDEGIRLANAGFDKIRKDTSIPTFENTILAIETAPEVVNHVAKIFFNLVGTNSDEEMQALTKEISPVLASFSSDLLLDTAIFKRVKAVWDARKELGLAGEKFRLTEKTYRDFVRNGALLDADKKNELRALDQKLSTLSPEFSDNVLKAMNEFKLVVDKKEDLDGVPESAVEAYAEAAKEAGLGSDKWLITLQQPSISPMLSYSTKRSLREKLWKAYNARAIDVNPAVLQKIVALRHERAKLLGYETHASFVLEERMAATPKAVISFLDRLVSKAMPAAKRDLAEVRKFKKETTGEDSFEPWDYAFWSEKLKMKLHNLDEEVLRPYFQLEKVVEGVFEHAKRLYGVSFKPISGIPVHHPDVKTFEVVDDTNGKHVGLFYADFFPRASKRSGAWMTSFREQGFYDWSSTAGGAVERPHVAIVCNFTKPTASAPSLLTLDEVKTLFHEFGHALHGLLSECEYVTMGGTNVYWDFVELPSQIMENWVGERESLAVFAKHYKTGETIPMELTEKIRKSSQFQAGYFAMRQINFAMLDMAWHSTDPASISDAMSFEKSVTAPTSLFAPVEGTNSSAAFSHIFAGGYSAGYYSYKWAEVLDADAFEFFKEEGLFNKDVATKFRKFVLSAGSSEDPMELYKKFRGREPDPDALLRRDGLI